MRVTFEDEPPLGIDLAPLIDCVFLLLIFFLVATTLKREVIEAQQRSIEEKIQMEIQEQLKVDLPEPAVSAKPVVTSNSRRITINAAGDFFFDGQPIGTAELHEQLRALAAANPNHHLIIDIDRHAESQYLIQLLDVCVFEGLSNYGIHTKDTIQNF
ncbi:biopolymer transporter ExbD [candidate division KSB1 bacterium]|nr:biopolymer transporter ExbD [candidate division KSB1 bacterium]